VTGDPVRDEAERLVAAAIAAFSLAARGLGGVAGSRRTAGHSGFATGSPECCVCPVCRVISAMRDPSPELAERLATGAGDLASTVAGILRSLSRTGVRPNPPEREGDEFWDNLGRRARDESRPPSQSTGSGWPGSSSGADEDPWRTATRSAAPPDDVLGPDVSDHDLLDDALLDGDMPPQPGPRATPPAKMAKKAVKKAAPPPPPPPTTPMARKAVKKAAPPAPPASAAESSAAPAAPPAKGAPAKGTPAKAAPAKKVAKKAAKKATPGKAEG
jgi:hypothetical protein